MSVTGSDPHCRPSRTPRPLAVPWRRTYAPETSSSPPVTSARERPPSRRGIGAGLGVRGPITSPTFVIARVHPSVVDSPPLVHVDAYRLGGLTELDALDLDASLEESVTVVEWGHGVAESLSEDVLEVTLIVDPATEERTARIAAHGRRWEGVRW